MATLTQAIQRVKFSEARSRIEHGDVLLYRGSGVIGQMLRVAGRSHYSHAAIVSLEGEREPQVIEVREFIGGRVTALRHQVSDFSGRIDLYRPMYVPLEVRREIVKQARELAWPGRYGWWAIFKCGLLHLPFVRWLSSVDAEEREDMLPHCSGLVSRAFRSCSRDLCPNLPDHLTEPGDIGRSALLECQFTLEAE
jgi:hypothetical protein